MRAFFQLAFTALLLESTLAGKHSKSKKSKSPKKAKKAPSPACSDYDKGYLQVNTVLSEAFKITMTNGVLQRTILYNAGFAGASLSRLGDPEQCLAKWDTIEEPKGILKEAIDTGKFKWCIRASDVTGPTRIDIAEEDIFLQGVQIGDLYGTEIDQLNALTIAMSKIIHAPLQPEFVLIEDGGVFFEPQSEALAAGDCYATRWNIFRHPYREQTVNYSCTRFAASELGFGLLAKESTDISDATSTEGEGLSICVVPGSTQATLQARTFPLATVVEVGSTSEIPVGVCLGLCDAAVDDIQQALSTVETEADCSGVTFGDAVSIPAPSSGGDGAAVTHRPLCDH